ncbi:lytic transglycosylase domain-containing protein [Nocardioides sp. Kera G14]|uniref:lytic transglycosylase domain-containing protein n=1 Tax=Nocardioides sp. Kera G14 TaxID=2884264 RepID=UPI001D113DF6|nr:lytic murein transglycosylase [Nocardioides sp. Kera G14]UDY23885.1 lytic murein transglycosylase [Nocardioides sp. Kera G14]
MTTPNGIDEQTRAHRADGRTRIVSGRTKRIATLVPLAMLSAAWTISISTSGASTALADDQQNLPDGTQVPGKALLVPASLTTDSATAGVTGESAQQIISTASASEIPAAALAAYQRAETVINKADPSCHLPWQLLGAIGRVESNHGRAQGNTLSDTGTVTPGIFGLPLNGTAGTARIADTDAGQYDGDTAVDRAVGPMQFIPSTWSTVGVDADGDGKRDPQDINDAALAAAVYLCSGDEDLSTDAGQEAAVLRYNHSESYVMTVMSVYRDYLAGDFSAIPNYVLPASYFEPAPAAPKTQKTKKKATTLASAPPSGGVATKPTAPSTTDSSDEPSTPSTSDAPSTPSVKLPKPTLPALPSTGVDPLDKTLTKAQATVQCLADMGFDSVNDLLAANPLGSVKALATLNTCVAKLTS